MEKCKPSFEKCVIDCCPYFREYQEIVDGNLHIYVKCERQETPATVKRKLGMTRLEAIDILEEIKVLDDSIYQYNQKYIDALNIAIDALKDTKLIRYGYWDRNHKCSCCNEDFYHNGVFYHTNYCPNCGAKMR